MDNSQNDFDYEPEDIEALDDYNNETDNKKASQRILQPTKKEEEYNIDLGTMPRLANKPSSNLKNLNDKMFTYDKQKSNNDDDILELMEGENTYNQQPKNKEFVKDALFDDEEDLFDLDQANEKKNNKNIDLPINKSSDKENKEKEDFGDEIFDELLGEDNYKNNEPKEKKKEEYEAFFLTGKEPSKKNDDRNKSKEIDYADLLNNEIFKKNTNEKELKETIHKSVQSNDKEEDYKLKEIKESISNKNDKEIVNNPIILTPNKNTKEIKKPDEYNDNHKKGETYNNLTISNSKSLAHLSSFEQSNIKYAQLKIEIDKVINTTVSLSNTKQLANQNVKMLQYLSDLNEILANITDHTKIPMKKQNIPNKESLMNISVNNDKILERYKNEYLKLKARLNQLSDSTYETKINDELNEVKTQIAYYEKENKNLRTTQKISEIILENQAKDPEKTHMKLKRIEMGYESIKNQYELYTKKVEKNKQSIKENEAKITELSDWKIRLEEKARDMYGITVFENVVLEEKKEKKIKDKISKLQKKINIIDGSSESNKKKYELEIIKNERDIFQKEEEKLELLKVLNEKRILSENCAKMIKALYAPTIIKQQNESEMIDNTNREIHRITIENNIGLSENNMNSIKKDNNEKEQFNINNPKHSQISIKEVKTIESKVEEFKLLPKKEDKKDELISKENKKQNSDCIFPIIKPKNKNVTESNNNNKKPNNSMSHNSRKPNFAFGFKKNDITNKDNVISENELIKKRESIDENINLNNDEKIIDYNNNYCKEYNKPIILEKKEEVKWDQNNDYSQKDIESEKNKAKGISLDNKTDNNHIPEFLRDNELQNKKNYDGKQSKQNIPSFLDVLNDDNENDNEAILPDSNHLFDIGKIKRLNNETIKEQKKNIIEIKESEERLPERKRIAEIKEKTKEEDNENAFNDLFDNNMKPTYFNKESRPYDEFADLEEFVI